MVVAEGEVEIVVLQVLWSNICESDLTWICNDLDVFADGIAREFFLNLALGETELQLVLETKGNDVVRSHVGCGEVVRESRFWYSRLVFLSCKLKGSMIMTLLLELKETKGRREGTGPREILYLRT